MEDPQQPPKKKTSLAGWITLVIGILTTLAAFVFIAGAVMLDIIGEKTIGELSNVSDCSAGRTCWTGKMDFTTASGEQIAFYPLTLPTFLNLDPYLRGKTYADQPEYQVRYLASYPHLAKVKLAFFLEYINHVLGLCLGSFLFMIGSALTKPAGSHKPLVIDLNRKK